MTNTARHGRDDGARVERGAPGLRSSDLAPAEQARARAWQADPVLEWASHLWRTQRDIYERSVPPGVKRDLPAYSRDRNLAERLGVDVDAMVAAEKERQTETLQVGAIRGFTSPARRI